MPGQEAGSSQPFSRIETVQRLLAGAPALRKIFPRLRLESGRQPCSLLPLRLSIVISRRSCLTKSMIPCSPLDKITFRNAKDRTSLLKVRRSCPRSGFLDMGEEGTNGLLALGPSKVDGPWSQRLSFKIARADYILSIKLLVRCSEAEMAEPLAPDEHRPLQSVRLPCFLALIFLRCSAHLLQRMRQLEGRRAKQKAPEAQSPDQVEPGRKPKLGLAWLQASSDT